ncbi:hypothetical protein FHG87_004224 [Trinorchestia longiramus]|nr:hypothetical protein FHG87_004224 [Trinorchestia longiramus]
MPSLYALDKASSACHNSAAMATRPSFSALPACSYCSGSVKPESVCVSQLENPDVSINTCGLVRSKNLERGNSVSEKNIFTDTNQCPIQDNLAPRSISQLSLKEKSCTDNYCLSPCSGKQKPESIVVPPIKSKNVFADPCDRNVTLGYSQLPFAKSISQSGKCHGFACHLEPGKYSASPVTKPSAVFKTVITLGDGGGLASEVIQNNVRKDDYYLPDQQFSSTKLCKFHTVVRLENTATVQCTSHAYLGYAHTAHDASEADILKVTTLPAYNDTLKGHSCPPRLLPTPQDSCPDGCALHVNKKHSSVLSWMNDSSNLGPRSRGTCSCNCFDSTVLGSNLDKTPAMFLVQRQGSNTSDYCSESSVAVGRGDECDHFKCPHTDSSATIFPTSSTHGPRSQSRLQSSSSSDSDYGDSSADERNDCVSRSHHARKCDQLNTCSFSVEFSVDVQASVVKCATSDFGSNNSKNKNSNSKSIDSSSKSIDSSSKSIDSSSKSIDSSSKSIDSSSKSIDSSSKSIESSSKSIESSSKSIESSSKSIESSSKSIESSSKSFESSSKSSESSSKNTNFKSTDLNCKSTDSNFKYMHSDSETKSSILIPECPHFNVKSIGSEFLNTCLNCNGTDSESKRACSDSKNLSCDSQCPNFKNDNTDSKNIGANSANPNSELNSEDLITSAICTYHRSKTSALPIEKSKVHVHCYCQDDKSALGTGKITFSGLSTSAEMVIKGSFDHDPEENYESQDSMTPLPAVVKRRKVSRKLSQKRLKRKVKPFLMAAPKVRVDRTNHLVLACWLVNY